MESVPLLSSHDGPGRVQLEDFGPTRNRKVEGSNPSSGSKTAAQEEVFSGVAGRAAATAGSFLGLDHRARRRAAPAGAPPPLRYVGVRPIDPPPVEALLRRPTPGDIVEDGTIQPALRTGRAFAHPPKPGCGCAALPTVPQVSCRRGSDGQVVCVSVAEVDLHRRGQ